MKKYYEDAKYNAAFVRCVDVMSQMLQKYGHQVLCAVAFGVLYPQRGTYGKGNE